MPDRIMSEIGRNPAIVHSGMSFTDPIVTFCCPTFGTAARNPDLLNEVVYWYMRQTYPHRELLILNDAPDQKLWCAPMLQANGVRIINWPMRIKTLGEKRNLLTTLAVGAICIVQDDDDISLPRRAEQAVRMLQRSDYWTPAKWWFYTKHGDQIKLDGNGYGHNCSVYRRAAMYNRYAKTSGDEDKLAHEWACKNLRCNKSPVEDPQYVHYIYRWGVSDRHISGFAGKANEMQEAYDMFDQGLPGEYEIRAVMQTDWVKRVQEELDRMGNQIPK